MNQHAKLPWLLELWISGVDSERAVSGSEHDLGSVRPALATNQMRANGRSYTACSFETVLSLIQIRRELLSGVARYCGEYAYRITDQTE